MFGYCHDMLFVIFLLSSVMRVYCDKTTEVRIMQFSHKSSVNVNFWHGKFDLKGVPLIRGSN